MTLIQTIVSQANELERIASMPLNEWAREQSDLVCQCGLRLMYEGESHDCITPEEKQELIDDHIRGEQYDRE